MTKYQEERIEQAKFAFKVFMENLKELTPELRKHATIESIKSFIKEKTEDEIRMEYGNGPYVMLKVIDLISGANAQSFYETINTFINTH